MTALSKSPSTPKLVPLPLHRKIFRRSKDLSNRTSNFFYHLFYVEEPTDKMYRRLLTDSSPTSDESSGESQAQLYEYGTVHYAHGHEVDGAALLAENYAGNGDLEAQVVHQREHRRIRVDPRIISDATIGLSDGLTVPFALTAGLATMGDPRVVVNGGMAELVAGAISMGLGGYLGAGSEADSYRALKIDQENLIKFNRDGEVEKVVALFRSFDIPMSITNDLAAHLATSPHLCDFMMRFHHCAEEPSPSRPLISGITISVSYLLAGFIPLSPYFFIRSQQVRIGLMASIGLMVITLFVFGYVKTAIVNGWSGRDNVKKAFKGAFIQLAIGSATTASAMVLVKVSNELPK